MSFKKTSVIGGTANSTLNNVALVSTDPQVSGGLFSITNLEGFPVNVYDMVLGKCSATVQASNSATAAIVTFTATTVATNTDYSFYLQQVPNGGVLAGLNPRNIYIPVNTNGVAAPTATTIATQVKNAVLAAAGLDVTVSGTVTAIITATTTNPILTGTVNSNGASTLVQTTAGVEEFGNYQYMQNIAAVTSGSGTGTFPQTVNWVGTPLSGHTYSFVKIVTRQYNYDSNTNEILTNTWDVYIDEGDADYAQWVLNYNKIMANFNATNYLVNKIPSTTVFTSDISAATNSTTLAQVNNAICGGWITNTGAGGTVAITLPTPAQIVTFLASLGITVGAGYSITFGVDCIAAHNMSLVVAAGMTFSTSNGGSLTITEAAATGCAYFTIAFESATVATLFRDK